MGNYSRDFCCLSFCRTLSSPSLPLLLLCSRCPRLSTAPLGPGCQSKALMRRCQLFVRPRTNGSLNRKNVRERERKSEEEREWPSWHVIICHLPPLLLLFCCLSHRSLILCLSQFLTRSLALYLLNTDSANVGLRLITGVITHILDDLIGEKAFKSS